MARDDRATVVVMIDSIAHPGGGERLAVENAIRLDPHRHRRFLCVTRWRDGMEKTEPAASLLKKLHAAGVEVIKVRRSSRFSVWRWWPLLRLLRRERVDVLHGHLFGANLWASILGRLARVQVVVAHEHMWAYGGNWLRSFLDRNVIARFSNAFVAVSAVGRQRMIDVERIDPADIVLIRNGIDGFEPGNRMRVRAELGLADEVPVVGSVGHLRPEKSFETLVEAVALAREGRPDLVALVAGEGPERDRLTALIVARGLEGSVRLLGARDDIPDFLAALDVAVCCSEFEGGPLSVMEYMEAGLPVVATEVGGLPELVRNGETGILVPSRNPAALADALSELVSDPCQRLTMGDLGQRSRREGWSLDRWASEVEELYARLRGVPFGDREQGGT